MGVGFDSGMCGRMSRDKLRRRLFRRVRDVHACPRPRPCSLRGILTRQFRLSSRRIYIAGKTARTVCLVTRAFEGRVSTVLVPAFDRCTSTYHLRNRGIIPVCGLGHLPSEKELV